MEWTWDIIQWDWLTGNGKVDFSDAIVLESFNRTDRLLGTDWIQRHRQLQSGIIHSGSSVTLEIIKVGLQLLALDGARNADSIIQRLRNCDTSAMAELTAIHLAKCSSADLDIAPPVAVGDRVKVPDFRIRRSNEPWTNVEVSRPSFSEEHDAARELQHRISE